MVAGADSSVRPAGNLAGSAAAAEAKSAQSERLRRDAPIPAPAAAGGLNELRARQSGQVNLVDQTARSAGLRTAELPATPVSAAHAGCYALRAPGPANTRLLGVPELVRLLEDPYPPDSTWRRGIPLEPASVPTSIIWRSLDSTTVEVHVRRPVDSTVVWFKAVLEGSPLGAVVRPPGTLIARADRVLCR
jgi:hypothetical protein